MQRFIYQTELSVAFLRNGKILVYKMIAINTHYCLDIL